MRKILSFLLVFCTLFAFSQNKKVEGPQKKQAATAAKDSILHEIQIEKEKNIAIYRRLLEQGLVTQEHFDEVVAMREKIASEKLANNTKSLEISTMAAEKPCSGTDKYSGGPKAAQANAGILANNPGQPCNCTNDFSGPQEKDIYWYHTDHLGSSSFVTGLDGEVNQNIEYFPSGEVFVENHRNSYNTPYKFNGKELDDETGYYYYGARYYNPRVSLWLNVDPLAEATPSWSPYAYAFNNPIRFVDPTGMIGEEVNKPNDWYWNQKTARVEWRNSSKSEIIEKGGAILNNVGKTKQDVMKNFGISSGGSFKERDLNASVSWELHEDKEPTKGGIPVPLGSIDGIASIRFTNELSSATDNKGITYIDNVKTSVFSTYNYNDQAVDLSNKTMFYSTLYSVSNLGGVHKVDSNVGINSSPSFNQSFGSNFHPLNYNVLSTKTPMSQYIRNNLNFKVTLGGTDGNNAFQYSTYFNNINPNKR